MLQTSEFNALQFGSTVISAQVAPEPKHPFADWQQYAEKHDLSFALLEELGISLAQFAINSVINSCPSEHGLVVEMVIFSKEPGTETPGTVTHRYFKTDLPPLTAQTKFQTCRAGLGLRVCAKVRLLATRRANN